MVPVSVSAEVRVVDGMCLGWMLCLRDGVCLRWYVSQMVLVLDGACLRAHVS